MKKNDSLIYRGVKVLSEELGLSLTLTYRHLADGSIPAIRLGNRYIISRSAVERWLSESAGKFPAVMK